MIKTQFLVILLNMALKEIIAIYRNFPSVKCRNSALIELLSHKYNIYHEVPPLSGAQKYFNKLVYNPTEKNPSLKYTFSTQVLFSDAADATNQLLH